MPYGTDSATIYPISTCVAYIFYINCIGLMFGAHNEKYAKK